MLDWTGERYLPWLRSAGAEIHYEHLLRYAHALQFVDGRKVLDMASGEGYGSFLMARKASQVVGVEIDPGAVKHARNRYGYLADNLTFMDGSITDVPIAGSGIFDVVVCFEALEHVEDHAGLLREVKRLIKSTGIFIVSTPNKTVYSDQAGCRNQFHVKELHFDELERLLGEAFRNTVMLGQRVYTGAFIWGLKRQTGRVSREFLVERGSSGFSFADAERKEPVYFLAVASDEAIPSDMATETSLLDVSNSYLEEFVALHVAPQTRALTDESGQLRSSVEDLTTRLAERDGKVHELEAQLERSGEEVTRLVGEVAQVREELRRKDADLRDREAVLLFRLDQLRQELSDARLTIALLCASFSWRVTSPLRRLSGALRRRSAQRSPELHLAVDAPDLKSSPRVSEPVKITGWAAGPDSVVRVEVLCDGELVGQADFGLPRPDVAATHPGLRGAERSGYAFCWNGPKARPGPHVLAVRAIGAAGRVAEATGTVILEADQEAGPRAVSELCEQDVEQLMREVRERCPPVGGESAGG